MSYSVYKKAQEQREREIDEVIMKWRFFLKSLNTDEFKYDIIKSENKYYTDRFTISFYNKLNKNVLRINCWQEIGVRQFSYEINMPHQRPEYIDNTNKAFDFVRQYLNTK